MLINYSVIFFQLSDYEKKLLNLNINMMYIYDFEILINVLFSILFVVQFIYFYFSIRSS
jgi:hypothetical protein